MVVFVVVVVVVVVDHNLCYIMIIPVDPIHLLRPSLRRTQPDIIHHTSVNECATGYVEKEDCTSSIELIIFFSIHSVFLVIL